MPAPSAAEIVLLVEDDRHTRDWLAAVLARQPGAEAPVCFGTAGQALGWLKANKPDIVLIDLGLPDLPGTEVIRYAATRWPDCDILVITMFGDEAHVVAALEAGASGYLLKDSSLDDICDHLQCMRQGGSPLTPRIARMLIRQQQRGLRPGAAPGSPPPPVPEPALPADALSQREHDVLTGIAKGFSYAEVAGALGLSTNTVRSHIKRIYQKLAVNSRSEAVYEFNQRQAMHGMPPLA